MRGKLRKENREAFEFLAVDGKIRGNCPFCFHKKATLKHNKLFCNRCKKEIAIFSDARIKEVIGI